MNTDCINENSDDLTPFKVGNKWIFRFYSYDTTGAVVTTFLDSFSVKRNTVIGKEKWYKIPGFKPADVDILDWYTNRSNGIWVLRRVISPKTDTAIAYLAFKYPTTKDESWGSPFGDSTRTISVNEIVTTPSGTDTCIKYEDHYEFYQLGDLNYYFAPHKGWVMLELFTQINSGCLYVVNRFVLEKAVVR